MAYGHPTTIGSSLWPSPNSCYFQITVYCSWLYVILVGGIPSPLKNICVRQLGWWHSQYDGKIIKVMVQTTNQWLNMINHDMNIINDVFFWLVKCSWFIMFILMIQLYKESHETTIPIYPMHLRHLPVKHITMLMFQSNWWLTTDCPAVPWIVPWSAYTNDVNFAGQIHLLKKEQGKWKHMIKIPQNMILKNQLSYSNIFHLINRYAPQVSWKMGHNHPMIIPCGTLKWLFHGYFFQSYANKRYLYPPNLK